MGEDLPSYEAMQWEDTDQAIVEEMPPDKAMKSREQVSAAHSYTQECCVRVKLMLTLTLCDHRVPSPYLL